MKVIYGIIFAVVYTIGYFFIAAMMTGGGHGNFIVMVPLGTWMFNFAALILLLFLRNKIIRVLFVTLMFIYYGLLAFTLIEALPQAKMINHISAVVFPAVWFLFGQIIIWSIFSRKIKENSYL